MVRLRTINFADIFTRPQHRLLDVGAARVWIRQHRNSNQHIGHHLMHALPGDDARENAAARLAQPYDGWPGIACRESALGCTDHVACRPLPGRTFLRYAGWRLGSDLDAFLLDLRPS